MIVERKLLLDMLQRAAVIARPTSPIPILGTARLVSAGGRLDLTATDLQTTQDDSCVCDGVLAPICAPARLLARIVAVCGGDSVALEAVGPDLVLRAGRAEFRLRCMAAADYPAPVILEGGVVIQDPVAGEVIRAAGRVVRIVRAGADRAFAAGVWIAVSPAGFDVLVVDGHHLVRIWRGVVDRPPVCVPPRAIRLATALIDAGASVVLRCAPEALCVETGAARIVARLINAELPDVKPEWVTPPRAPDATICDRAALLAAVERIAGEKVTLEGAAEGIVVARDEGDLVAREAIDAVRAATFVPVHLAVRYLHDALEAVSSETVALTIGIDKPVRIDGAEGELAVIAPMAGVAPSVLCSCDWPGRCDGDETLYCGGCGPNEAAGAGECSCSCGGTRACSGCERCER